MMAPPAVNPRGISLINADLGRVRASSLRVVRSLIQSIGENPAPGDVVVDLRGDRLLPGLINSHDHLQLNGFPRLKYRDHYSNVREWIEDITARKSTDAQLLACQSIPLRARQLHGGLKNILSGVTTVVQHDPIGEALLGSDFPVRVVERVGWSHSLAIDGELRVQRCYRDTPSEWPWIIHAAEGVDREAAREFATLDALGCIAANTLIVHGIGTDTAQRRQLASAGAGLIWCPSSNMHLFGTTLDVRDLAALNRVALGTDSRMSGERDLLAELSKAHRACGLDSFALESMVTSDAARLLRLQDRGSLSAGMLADLLILPPHMPAHQTTRADIRLVMQNGLVRLGDAHYVRLLEPATHWTVVGLDGHAKLMDRALATLLLQTQVQEDGLEMQTTSWRAA